MESPALNAAIELEQSGYVYYREVAEKTENPLTARLFSSLAAQELEHIQRARELYAAGGEPAVHSSSMNLEADVKRFFGQFSKEQRQDWKMDNAEAYERAMELEKQGYDMYAKFAAEARDEREAAFFKALQREEEGHLEALENVYAYFAQSKDWQHEDERTTWNWMNL
ncbi:MAG: ferritin family protein [bacterium]|nr:ferritin family protein [bacterium]